MPHIWNNILAVTYEELVPEHFATKKYLSVRLSRAKKRGYGIKKIREGKGKNSPALIEFDSLPENVKLELGDPRKTGHILEEFYITDIIATDFYADHRFYDGTTIDDLIQDKYAVNASVLNAVKRLKSARETERTTKGFSARGVFKSLTEDATSFNEVLNKKYGIQHDLPSNQIRFKEKYKLYHEKGYSSLITKYHKNKNGKKVTDQVEILLNNIFAGVEGKPTATEIARQYDTFLNGYLHVYSKETAELFVPKGYPKLSKGTITNFLASWNSKMGTLPRRNKANNQILMQQTVPSHSLYDPKFAGELISIDDRNPPFKYIDNKRVWFYMGIDLGADAWTVWVHGKTKKGIIVEFYRQMVRNYHEWGFNLPLELEAERSLNSSFEKTFLQEGKMFSKVRIEANKARAKKVERKFGAFRYEHEKDLRGFVPRPNPRSEANQVGNIKIEDIPTIPYNQIVENSLNIIQLWNNQLHPNQELHTGMTRWEVFAEKQTPITRSTNYRGILPHLGYKTESSCNAGIIKLQGQQHLLGDKGEVYSGKNLINLMKLAEGRQLDIYWLDGNDGKIIKALVYIKGQTQYICEAVAKPRYSRAQVSRPEEENELRAIMSSYSNTITSYMKTQAKEIDRVYVTDNTPKHKPRLPFKVRKESDTDTELEQNIAFDIDNIEVVEETVEETYTYEESTSSAYHTY